MKLVNKRILITAGEPASISSEITIKALEKLKNKNNAELIILTDPILIKHELNCNSFCLDRLSGRLL